MKARVLVAASSKKRARSLAKALSFLHRRVDTISGKELPRTWSYYRLLVCEVGPRLKTPFPLLTKLRNDAHVVLILPDLDVRWVAYYMQDKRVNHFLSREADTAELQAIVGKLETGSIFGMDRYLPPEANITYRRLRTYKKRCETLEEIEAATRKARLRGHLRRASVQVAEELLMNAMYQAPVDETGARIYEDIEPRIRIRRRTPRPISLRFSVHNKSFFLSVRDRFGSFTRRDLAHYLLRCVTEESPMEDKKLGAGLGLYVVGSASRRLIINVLPGYVSEFIAVLEPHTSEESPLRQLSVTTHVAMPGMIGDEPSDDAL